MKKATVLFEENEVLEDYNFGTAKSPHALSPWPNTNPIYLAVDTATPSFTSVATDANYGVVRHATNSPHAVVNSEAPVHIWVSAVRSLVCEYPHDSSFYDAR